ncbi:MULTISPECIES: glycosyltransferase family 2 protein [unclassified Paracoccus (in: a-proteobacteria)]|uniref:glycosyltransferase family 2 protein n=1 Tax=unclassified Paracoccus (in: a-proteobacteria) TaxID=2688777 RepID=UPI001E29802A|nr:MULTISPECIES: glycosyltransferase family 2 protein [unclassified Paracoccus (in: a-proteobacteria)]UXU76175.1 glycosyltransferase family 2 protein [Paracoccus sp. SMMA_5]UXU82079.1 glycosyltransferase family 2 protein [Paracoccus sp. SMMA_5_TC]
MTMTAPSVHVIVLNWRTPGMSLEAATAAMQEMQGLDGGITIVDNDSGDGSFDQMRAEVRARGWPDDRVAVVQSGWNGGYGAGNNHGIRQGLPDGRRADLVYLLNSDAIPQPGSIRALVDYLGAHPQAGIACSRLRGVDDVPHTTAFRFPTAAGEFEQTSRTGPITRLLRRRVVSLPQPVTSGRVDWSAGASMMIRMDVLDNIGLFDEGFFLYYEETDLCRRAAAAGWQTHYVVESLVLHIGSVSTGMKQWRRPPDYWYDSRRRYFEKHHGRWGALGATAAHLAGAGVFSLRCLLSGRRPDTPPGHLSYLLRHALRAQPRPQHVEKGKP